MTLIFGVALFIITNVHAQDSTSDMPKFRVPNSNMEVKFVGQSYQVIKEGLTKEFRQKTKIRFRDLIFDPLIFSPEEFIPAYLKQGSSSANFKNTQDDENAYIIQFRTQAFEGYQQEIIKIGGEIYTPLHDHAIIIILPETELEKVRNLPFVRWVGVYHPSFKLEESLKNETQLKHSEKVKYSILLLDKSFQNELISFIQEIGGVIDLKTSSSRFEASLNGIQLLAVANRQEVLFIDKWTPISDDMDIVRSTQGINYIETVANYTGQGVNGEVVDDGLYTRHIDFSANPPVIHGENDNSNNHGTSVYGIVFGNGAGDGNARGIIPDAKTPIFSSRHHILDRYQHTSELVDPSGNYRAVFQTNSWGSELTTEYTTISAELDQIVFDFDLLILQSQSNEGTQMSRPQAWAKNVVSVGGIRHYNTATRTDDAWGGETGASIGPASDGRLKPDLSNFYDYTHTSKSNGSHGEFSGTSGATPITAGHFGLFFQMWAEGVFSGDPSLHRNVFDSRPHMSTAKAIMINLAYQYEFMGSTHDKTRVHQGWGMADIKNVFQRAKENNWHLGLLIDESDILLPLAEKTYEINVDGKSPLKITLVYSDPAGSPGSSKHLVNDLSLKVIDPLGEVYWGNNGLKLGNWSIPDGESNHLDNVENVFIKTPKVGNWQIIVLAEEIVKDAHPETEEIDADYALIVSGNKTNNEPQYFNLTTTFADGDSIILEPPGSKYEEGEMIILTPKAKEGHKFLNWEGDAQGSAIPLTVIMDSNISIGAHFIEMDPSIGNNEKFTSLTSTANRRAMPYIAPHEGIITSVSMYHNGGSRNMLLGVYGGTEQTPTNLMGVTPITPVSPNDDWQTINLISPVNIADSQQVWLAWVYQDNPGIYYTEGQPGRVESGFPWGNGMPESWGDTAKMANSIYSIYANFLSPDTLNSRISGPSSAMVNEIIQLSSDSSSDPYHTIISYEWSFGDGNLSNIANPSHTFHSFGTFNITLKITNTEGNTHTSIKEIIVSAPNQLPLAEANGPYSGKVDSVIIFSKLGSFDPEGLLTAYMWNFGDGTRSQLSNPTHIYTEVGVYVVSLTVADQMGKIAVDTALVSVSDFTLSDDLFEATGNEFLIYPNPVSSSRIKLTFRKDERIVEKQVRLMNMQGLLLKEYLTNENEFLLNLETLPNGMYLIIVQTMEKMMGSKILLLR